MYNSNLPCIVFGTDDAEAEYQPLKEKGVVFRKLPTVNQWGAEAVFEDGFGNLIQIHAGES